MVRDQEQAEVRVAAVAEGEWVVIALALDPLANVYVQTARRKCPTKSEFLAIL
ncbi:hypothetical protein ES706_03700 [subsurface metagenome]